MYTIEELNLRLLSELKEIAEELGVKNYKRLSKKDLIYKILDQQAILPENELPKKKSSLSETPSETPKKEAPKAEVVEEEKPKRARRRENVTDVEDDKPKRTGDRNKPEKKEQPAAEPKVLARRVCCLRWRNGAMRKSER